MLLGPVPQSLAWHTSSVSHLDLTIGAETQTADDFILTGDADITAVQWASVMDGFMLQFAFRIMFYLDDGRRAAPRRVDPAPLCRSCSTTSPQSR